MRTRASSSRTWNGLLRKSVAPNFSTCIDISSGAWGDITSTGMSRHCSSPRMRSSS
jgi:hypothetical protein